MRARKVVRYSALGAALLLTTLPIAAPRSSLAQAPSAVTPAPLPTQITSARRVFVSNVGSDSYGPEVYYELTKYDGGPDRLYNLFYAALKQWARLDLVGEPAQADVVYAVRFASPAVAKRDSLQLLYDPQLNLAIIDPHTRVTLWSLTEHIEPARARVVANENFDRAVRRLVDHTKLLTESPSDAARLAALAPAGAERQFELRQRRRHSAIGSAIGFSLAAAYEMSTLRHVCPVSSPPPCSPQGPITRALLVSFTAASGGGLIGWSLPVGRPHRLAPERR